MRMVVVISSLYASTNFHTSVPVLYNKKHPVPYLGDITVCQINIVRQNSSDDR